MSVPLTAYLFNPLTEFWNLKFPHQSGGPRTGRKKGDGTGPSNTSHPVPRPSVPLSFPRPLDRSHLPSFPSYRDSTNVGTDRVVCAGDTPWSSSMRRHRGGRKRPLTLVCHRVSYFRDSSGLCRNEKGHRRSGYTVTSGKEQWSLTKNYSVR